MVRKTVLSGRGTLRDTNTEIGDVVEGYAIKKTIVVRADSRGGKSYKKLNERLRGFPSGVKESA